ncbi:MAG: hypothetical protein ACNI28_08295 [Arcobacter sp.]|uniref:hypothetical protein n=1 Tax=Arcobacter sp. TaxID=1872629 RepID=UPI003AFF80C6
MLVVTTDSLPDDYKIKQMYPMIEVTSRTQISQKGIIQGIIDRNRNEHQEAYDELCKSAPFGANAIIGVKVSTSTHQFKEGTFLYMTYIGTPVFFESETI